MQITGSISENFTDSDLESINNAMLFVRERDYFIVFGHGNNYLPFSSIPTEVTLFLYFFTLMCEIELKICGILHEQQFTGKMSVKWQSISNNFKIL